MDSDVARENTGTRVRPGKLLQVLGTAFGLAMAIGATIGGGILRTPGDVAGVLPSAFFFMGVWVFGGLSALCGVTVYAELGAMAPRSGGIYGFAHRAFGPGVGFFVGYADWLNWSIASAALVLLVGEYAGAMLPALAGHSTLLGFIILAVIFVLQWIGVRSGGRTQEVTSLLKTLALLGLIAAAFVLPRPEVPASTHAVSMPHGLGLIAALALAMQGVIFTYDSYYAIVYCGEEIRNPAREIPRSIFRGLILIVAIYLLINASFLAVLPVESMAHDPFVGGSVAAALFGQYGDSIIRSLMIISLFGTINAQIMATPRILYAMSRDGLFPHQATQINRGGTPGIALIISFLLVALLLFSGSFNALLGVDAILIATLYIFTFAAFFVLRRREPETHRPYRAWGYPWVPGVALVIAVAFLAAGAIGDLRDTLIVAAALIASYPAGLIVRRWARLKS